MSENSFLSAFWQGFISKSVAINHSLRTFNLILDSDPNHSLICSHCHTRCQSIHDVTVRTVRDCNILNYLTYVQLPVRRVNCPSCQRPRKEHISWLPKYSHQTTRLIEYIEQLCRILPISHVAELVKLHWSTIRNIDKNRLEKEVEKPDYSKITKLVMDEFALHKGHRYATVIADAETMKILWVGEGRSRENIRPFFKELGIYCKNIEAVAMDMNTSFDLEVKMHCTNAEVVYDLFHVIAKYGREVIDRVRVDRANELRHDKKARKVVKRGRWLLLRNRANLTAEQDERLDELLEANQPLSTVYILKEQLKEIWRSKTVWEAFRKWSKWFKQVAQSTIKPLKDFARKLKPYCRGILSAAKYPLNTSCLEGINNKIKLIKRMGYGFRDTDYFFLKIKAAFPGKP